MTINLTDIVLSVIALIGAIISRYLIPWIRNKLTDHQYEVFNGLVRTGVYAAEQLFNSNEGRKKKDYVISLLKRNGYEVDDLAVDALIESTVKELRIEMGQTLESIEK